MANKTVTNVDEYEDVRKFTLFAGVAILIVCYIRLLNNRSHWIIMEACFGVVYALCFPFAGVLSSYFMKESDALSIYIFRLMLVALVAQASAIYLAQKSRDRTVPVAVSISNILGRGPMLMLLLLTLYAGKFYTKNKESTYIDTVIMALLLFGDIFFMSRAETRQYRSRTVGDPISFHLSVDALIAFFIGSLMLGFPDMFCSVVSHGFKLSENHFFTLRGVGVMFMSGSMLSFASLCYRDDEDAINTLKTKLVVYLPAILLALTNMLIDKQFRTYGHAGIMIGAMGGLALNAGSMVYRHEKQD